MSTGLGSRRQRLFLCRINERGRGSQTCATVLDLDEFISPGNHPQRIRDYCGKTGQEAPEGRWLHNPRSFCYSLALRYKQVLELLKS